MTPICFSTAYTLHGFAWMLLTPLICILIMSKMMQKPPDMPEQPDLKNEMANAVTAMVFKMAAAGLFLEVISILIYTRAICG